MESLIDRKKGRRSKGRMGFHCLLLQFLLNFASLKVVESSSSSSSAAIHEDPVWNIRHVLPKMNLENNSLTDVYYNVGDAAFLPCRIPHNSRHHEGSVSWIRRWDWQILSAGVYTNTNDGRITVLHREGSEDWTLQIKYVRMSDNGTYDCQVHTGSGFLSQFVNLHIVEPRARIAGAKEIHVSSGESFTLTCYIEKMISPPVYVMWLHKNTPLNYAPDRPRLTVETNPRGIHTTSVLRVVLARYDDSGNYTCTAPNADSASVMVYVTEGDAVAAIQRIESLQSASRGRMMQSISAISCIILAFITTKFNEIINDSFLYQILDIKDR